MGRKFTTAFRDKLSKLRRDHATQEGVVGKFFYGFALKELAHGDDATHELIRVYFFLSCKFTHPKVLL